MPRRLALILVFVATIVAGAVVPAAAHRPPAADALPAESFVVPVPSLTEVMTSAAPAPASPWAAMAVIAVAALAVAWRPRRVLALTLVLVAGVLAFETGVHSAHHLGQAEEAARCAVAAMATQLSADLAGTAPDTVPVHVIEILVAAPAAPVVPARPVAPDAGRAPPVLPA
jgi:hypothetical protein